jgi:hypothetical protein
MTDPHAGGSDVRRFRRNRWFTGKVLDAYHMQLESDGEKDKRWMINRLVLGWGVAIGLDVRQAGSDPLSFVVTQGLAFDKYGREIIVPAKESAPVQIDHTVVAEAIKHQLGQGQPPASQGRQTGQGGKGGGGHPGHCVVIQLQIGYRETLGDPVPADYGDDCPGASCVPGSIYEGYYLRFLPDPAKRRGHHCEIEELRNCSPSDFHAILARWVTRDRANRLLKLPLHPGLALANIEIAVDDGDKQRYSCHDNSIDITVREIVYCNDILYDLILAVAEGPSSGRHGGK